MRMSQGTNIPGGKRCKGKGPGAARFWVRSRGRKEAGRAEQGVRGLGRRSQGPRARTHEANEPVDGVWIFCSEQ